MKLLINTIIYNNKYPPIYEAFLQSLVSTIAQSYEGTNIIILCEAKYNNMMDDDKINIITLSLKQRLWKKALYKKQIQSILKKEKPNVIWYVDVAMIGFYTIPCYFLWSRRLKISIKKEHQLLNASTIYTILTDDEKIQQQFLHTEKIKYWLAAPYKAFRPLSWEQKMHVCETYTHGHAYFHLYAEQLPALAIVACLKAFSIFKQWQKSQMKLVITSKHIPHHLSTLLQTYKFKNDVFLLPYISLDDLAIITTSAYATLYCASTDFLGWYTTSCATAKVLTITDRSIAVYEHAVLSCAWDYTSLSKAMIMLYKDEQLQQKIKTVQDLLLNHLFSSALGNK